MTKLNYKALVALFVTLFLTLLIYAVVGHCQEIGKWRTAHDTWTGDDKWAHCMGSYFLCSQLDNTMRLDKAIVLTWLAGLAWEVKDAYLPYEKVGYFGGDGFSRRDLVADYVGVYSYVFLNYVVFHKNRGKYALWVKPVDGGATIGVAAKLGR